VLIETIARCTMGTAKVRGFGAANLTF